MDRRHVLLTSLAGALAAPLAAEAQQAGKVYRLGSLTTSPPAPGIVPKFPFLIQRLRELGYVEGHNLIIEQRFGGLNMDRYPALVGELVGRDVDVIVCLGGRIAAVAMREAPKTPIVMVGGVDPVADGLAASLKRPGGNVTGLLQDVGRDVNVKQLELLKELVPRSSRIAIFSGGQAQSLDRFHFLLPAATKLGVALHHIPIEKAGDVEPAFAAVVRDRNDAVLILPTPAILVRPQAVIDFAARHKIPAAYWWTDIVHLGGLMAYGIDWGDLMRRAGSYVDKIFKGAQPADLPIEQPTKFELLINLKTAKALGLTIPPSLLARADQVIE